MEIFVKSESFHMWFDKPEKGLFLTDRLKVLKNHLIKSL